LWQTASLTPRASDKDALDPETPRDITGLRVLIAEDEMLIAYDLEEELCAAGCEVVANCQHVGDVEAALDRLRPDVAILDINLRGELVYPAAERLRVLGIPFIFASGYEAALNVPERFSGVPTVSKPYRA
jgi:CheY-like chemotaxis protein